ncbi:MmcQ/YjbR family DNA-binding protein [Chitinophaga vietnamensis]|uniref:MmcQ/YjbR family DNA-binding protein n=1 Tax=Chitinophaga vietnamensis TaxID=2593957 RepID=UPI001177D922|nr:MmcQ/YjbR family DNA-binding protein [Chitinophaga vietnamensis]
MFDHTLDFCRAFPAVTTEQKWDNELRFFVGEKLFCMLSMEPPHRISFKCSPALFHQLIARPGIVPAPHLARYHWVQLKQEDTLPLPELQAFLHDAYEIVVATLPPGEQDAIHRMKIGA